MGEKLKNLAMEIVDKKESHGFKQSNNSSDGISMNTLGIRKSVKEVATSWLERNRNLVLRQTPVWAQSMAAIMIGLGGLAVVGGILFRIDEVVTVQGQLKSIGGTVEVKSPAGGQVAEVFTVLNIIDGE